jgi:hypothetical protein
VPETPRPGGAGNNPPSPPAVGILDRAAKLGEPGVFSVKGWPIRLDAGMEDHIHAAWFTEDSRTFAVIEAAGSRNGEILTYLARGAPAPMVIEMMDDPADADERASSHAGRKWLREHARPRIRKSADGSYWPPRPSVLWRYASEIEVSGKESSTCRDAEQHPCSTSWQLGGQVRALASRGAPVVYPLKLTPLKQTLFGSAHPDWIGLSPDGRELAVVVHGFCQEYCDPVEFKVLPVDDFASEIYNLTGLYFHRRADFLLAKELFLKAYHASSKQARPLYNLACALARLRDPDAPEVLARAIELDGNARTKAAKDPDFAQVKQEPWFLQLTTARPTEGASLPRR